MIDAHSCPALAGRTRLQLDPVDGEPVLLYPEGLLRLNASAHAVLALCDGRHTVEAVIESLAREFEAPAETLRADVLECLADFQQRQLLVFRPPIPAASSHSSP